MSETKFTPGPWTLELVQTPMFGVIIKGGNCEILRQDAFCHSTAQKTRRQNETGVGFEDNDVEFVNKEEAQTIIATQDANAHLIAAAPELYEALEAVLAAGRAGTLSESFEQMKVAHLLALAALRKARGES